MASVTYYVALAFTRSVDGGIVACEPKEARSPDQASCWPALRRAQSPWPRPPLAMAETKSASLKTALTAYTARRIAIPSRRFAQLENG